MVRSGSGLDIDLGDRCSRTAFGWAKRTFAFRRGRMGEPLDGLDGSFSNVMRYGSLRLAMCTDGIGTKVELAERTGIYETLGHDLVAMVADDLAANGIEPVNLTNVLDVDHLDEATVDRLLSGLHDAARIASVAVVGGEIAELGDRVGGWGTGMRFNWSATAVGVLPPGREPLDGQDVRPGDVVVALASRGFRSNGFSLARRVLEEAFGPHWHGTPFGDSTWGEALLTPSLIYSPVINRLLDESVPVTAAAHITGGGIAGNFARALSASGCGATLPALFPPHPAMVEAQRLGRVGDDQAYRLWNMGNGMLLTVRPGGAEDALALCRELGYRAQAAGETTVAPAIDIPHLRREP